MAIDKIVRITKLKLYLFIFLVYIKMLEITKETWEKCGIKTIEYYNKEEDINELWQKMIDAEAQISHSNIADAALKRIRKYCGKKTKDITEEEKEKYKSFLEGESGIFIIEKLTRDIIERCKLPETIELRKKSGYNHNDIMIWEETSIAKKIIKLFPEENIALNKKFNNRKPDIWFEGYNIIIEADEGNHKNYDTDDEKKREDMFIKHNLKTFGCNPNDPSFDLFKFLGEINLYVSRIREKVSVNGVISKITEDFKKIVAVTKLKELKRYAKNILRKYKKWKKIREEIKNKPIINIKYKNKMKIYCVKCKKDTENIDQK